MFFIKNSIIGYLVLILNMISIRTQSSQYYYSIIKGRNVSTNVSSYLTKKFNDRMDCLNMCTSYPRCTLIYMDLNKKICIFYKMISIDKFLIPLSSDSNNIVIYRRNFKTAIKQIWFGGSAGGYNKFNVNFTLNGNNSLSKIVFKCYGFTKKIDFVYSNSETITVCIDCSSPIQFEYSIDLADKEIVYIGHAAGTIMNMLEFCLRDLITSVITCRRGCNAPLSREKFDLYEIVSFMGDFNNGTWNALNAFGFQYIGVA